MNQSACLHSRRGFTLIELSIVLVIIGLIVGGVLVGRDLVSAAALRSQIAQVDSYNAAVRTFQTKYRGLPGDLSNAATFGFTARGSFAGEGDGNGIIEGVDLNGAGRNQGYRGGAGETLAFWTDLSAANLVEGRFTAGSPSIPFAGSILPTTTPAIKDFFPAGKMGTGIYVYVWSGGMTGDGQNYFAVAKVDDIDSNGASILGSAPAWNRGLTTVQAYNIDVKVDDGKPTSGRVLAMFVDDQASWANLTLVAGPDTLATAQDAYTCYDNNGVGGAIPSYSTGWTADANFNCALSFRFQ